MNCFDFICIIHDFKIPASSAPLLDQMLDVPIYSAELKKAVEEINLTSANGPDGMGNEVKLV